MKNPLKKREKHINTGTGISKAEDPFTAGKEAVEMAYKDIGGKPQFGLVFASGGTYAKKEKDIKRLVEGVHESMKGVPWAGATSCGEIMGAELESDSCIVMLMSSDFIQFGLGVATAVHKDPLEAGKKVAQEAMKNMKLERIVNPYLKYTAHKTKDAAELMKLYEYLFLLFSPGLTLDNPGYEDQVLMGVQRVLGKQYPVIGGTSGDDLKMLANYQFADGKLYDDAAVMVSMSLGLRAGFGFSHGYTPTGKTTLVSDADGYLVKELDGKPALDRYAELLEIEPEELWDTKSRLFNKTTSLAKAATKYFGVVPDPKMMPFFSTVTTNPLAVSDIHGNFAIRVAKAVKKKTIEFNHQIPQNVVLHKLEVDPKKVLEAETTAIDAAIDEAGADPAVIFLFDCELRKIYSGDDQIASVISKLKKKYKGSVIFGFNTMGEYTFSRSSEPMANSATVSVGVISNRLVTD